MNSIQISSSRPQIWGDHFSISLCVAMVRRKDSRGYHSATYQLFWIVKFEEEWANFFVFEGSHMGNRCQRRSVNGTKIERWMMVTYPECS